MKFIVNYTFVRPLQNIFTAVTLAVTFAAANAAETPVSWEEAGERAQAIVKKMSFEDKVKFTGGGTVRVAGGAGAEGRACGNGNPPAKRSRMGEGRPRAGRPKVSLGRPTSGCPALQLQ